MSSRRSIIFQSNYLEMKPEENVEIYVRISGIERKPVEISGKAFRRAAGKRGKAEYRLLSTYISLAPLDEAVL